MNSAIINLSENEKNSSLKRRNLRKGIDKMLKLCYNFDRQTDRQTDRQHSCALFSEKCGFIFALSQKFNIKNRTVKANLCL